MENDKYVPFEDGYIFADGAGGYFVMRQGMPARNWPELFLSAQKEVTQTDWEKTHKWTETTKTYYPLSRELAQHADFPPRPTELEQYNQLNEQFPTVAIDYDLYGALEVFAFTADEDEQRKALELMRNMSDISPNSVVQRPFYTPEEVTNPWDSGEGLPKMMRLSWYLEEIEQKKTQELPHFDFDR
ncbi:hypothetical protein EPA93_43245 [Ktedonosporobacter rubrisoli]|uniref:Uncharacterized protein n=1 Tax=Ktedonosporobacter rubrisoli TaxID=2509675 RepID=A0A4P6K3A4_KTERU|nr:hypothetical protein [Ktedonosporobacter rubrisoli]QBD82432.1 hypothetical protein EPA93_43245 [Ktedonosporobacter rubrisoli]